jgi:hypothetical protein
MEANKKSYENLSFGFDRTQMFKEVIQPQNNRSTALHAVMSFCSVNQIKMTNMEIMALCKKYVNFIENGDIAWAKSVDEYLAKKQI